MRRTLLLASTALAIGLVFLALLLLTVKPAPTVAIHYVTSIKNGREASLTIEITNSSARPYVYCPREVEARNGRLWARCFQFQKDFRKAMPSLLAHTSTTCTFDATDLPMGAPLRFKLRVQKTLTGMEGLMQRLKMNTRANAGRQMRVHSGGELFDAFGPIPLNPFDKSSKVFGRPIETVSEEFTLSSLPASAEPEPSADSPGSTTGPVRIEAMTGEK